MQVFNVTSEPIKKPKRCSHCDTVKESGSSMYYGHTILFSLDNNKVKDLHWTCEDCVKTRHGYLTECFCMDYL